jgi:hypothetical protein
MWCGRPSTAAVSTTEAASATEAPASAPPSIVISVVRYIMHGIDLCANLIIRRCAERSKVLKAVGILTFVLLSLVSASRSAHAGEVFDPISQQFTDATTGWMQNSYELGTHIFLSLAAVMLVYNIVSYYLAYESLQGIGSVIVRSLLGIALPYGILQAAPNLLYNLVGTAGQLLGKINAGATPLPAAVATGNTVSPDSLAQLGIQIGWQLPTTAFSMMAKMGFQSMNIGNLGKTFSGNAHQAIVDLILGLATMLSGFGILLAFWYIAAELLTAYIEVSFVAPLGAWALGFMAAPATTAIAESYVQTIVRMIMRFIAILAMAAIVQNISEGWLNVMANLAAFNPAAAPNTGNTWPVDVNLLKTSYSMLGGTLILLYIVRYISRISGNILTGSPTLSGRGMLSHVGNHVGTNALQRS